MSKKQTTPKQRKIDGRSKNVRILIALSFFVSGSILIFAFTMPFRQPGSPLVSAADRAAQNSSGQLDLAEEIRERRSNADQFREAAIKLDNEFMKTFVKGKTVEPVPGLTEAKTSWQDKADSVRKRMSELGGDDKDSLEWQHQMELAEALRDAPQ